MRELVTSGHDTKSETEDSIDLRSFLMSQVTAGQETETEDSIDLGSFLMR